MAKRETEKIQEQIAATLAHEIKNPLALIKASLQYIELSDKDQTYRKNYNVIYREIDRINEIVVEFLDQRTPKKLYLKRFKLSDLFVDLALVFDSALSEKNISLKVNSQDEGLDILADYNKIKQVFINLIQNASDAIELRREQNGLSQEEYPGLIDTDIFAFEQYVSINIKDNGIGISSKDLKSVGTPFFTTKENGTGLGVSISKGIISMHKGTMTITGVADKGTTAAITLPIGKVSPKKGVPKKAGNN